MIFSLIFFVKQLLINLKAYVIVSKGEESPKKMQ